MTDTIEMWRGGLAISRDRFNALVSLRDSVLNLVRSRLRDDGFVEITTSSLTQMTGSCERVESLFDLDYYGRRAFLAQSAQLQLEYLVARLRRPVFTVTTSFRAEHYESPADRRRRLSEFTLFELESPGWGLDEVAAYQENLLFTLARGVIDSAAPWVAALGGDIDRLRALRKPFPRIAWAEAVDLLGIPRTEADGALHELTAAEELQLIAAMGGGPCFLERQPLAHKFFNFAVDRKSGFARSLDLLCPPIGEIAGGGERATSFDELLAQLEQSRMLRSIEARGGSIAEFEWYLELFRQGEPVPKRAGFGIGFERLIAFLIDTDDVLSCVAFPRNDVSLFP